MYSCLAPSSSSSNANRSALAVVTAIGGSVAIIGGAAWYLNRKRRGHWQKEEEEKYGHDALPSIFGHFKSLCLDPSTSVDEANKRRTASYYEKSRQAHSNELVIGVGPRSRLERLRREEVGRILSYWHRGDQSHRTIVVMCDRTTQIFLSEARENILAPLGYSSDIRTGGAWIPDLNVIPEEDMHVTVALPWWWHTIREGNTDLSRQIASRFHQTLLLEFHYAFQIELERIVLLGGKVLVALWRCVGERSTEDGTIVYDRHGESVDPFVRLREEIVRCFTTESPDSRRQPLTYQHKKSSEDFTEKDRGGLPARPSLGKLERQPTIQKKTPGMGLEGKADGFIHTTLCRLSLECLSSQDVELGPIHRLCREASAALGGHRMAVSRYRFIETMGEGGESNPCVNPIYDETIAAPVHRKVDMDGKVTKTGEVQRMHEESANTIGPGRNFMSTLTGAISSSGAKNSNGTNSDLDGLFKPPN